MEKIKCQTCGKELQDYEPIFGSLGNYFCATCFKPDRNLFRTNKKTFRNNKKKWNEMSKSSSDRLMAKVKGLNYYN